MYVFLTFFFFVHTHRLKLESLSEDDSLDCWQEAQNKCVKKHEKKYKYSETTINTFTTCYGKVKTQNSYQRGSRSPQVGVLQARLQSCVDAAEEGCEEC